MKKILSVIAVGAVAIASSQAQGTVGFSNGTSSKISVNSSIGGTSFTATPATANAYYYALFYSASATTVNGSSAAVVGGPNANSTSAFVLGDSNWSYAAGSLGASITTAGRFVSTTADANGNTTVTGVSAGGVAQFVVIGWSANIGSTEASLASFLAGTSSVQTGWVGESIPSGAITTGAGVGLPPGLFGAVGNTAGDITGFSLGEVQAAPEPASIALAALGGLSLLGLRRKKA